MKSLFKKILVAMLGGQVKRLCRRNQFKVIGVVGSIGKTSTKLAIAQILKSERRVQYQEGNYNDIVSVPLVFFGQKIPDILWNIFHWLKILIQNEIQIYLSYPFDFVVLELGTDAPRQIIEFKKYLHLNVLVVTAITLEHMEFFRDLKEVAKEEWSASSFSDIVLANADLCTDIPDGLDDKKVIFYGKDFKSAYKLENILKTEKGFSFDISHNRVKIISASHSTPSEVGLYSICAAVAVSEILGISIGRIQSSIAGVQSLPGRMQRLKGINGSVIIDDTYNASPSAMKIALDTLYAEPASRRIAIIGMMNELGNFSKEEHIKIGKYCNPKLLNLVVTVGKDANLFTAPSARANGCFVHLSVDSTEAGLFVKDKIQKRTVILAKGSQNGVFVEEALKPLLLYKSDTLKLVRQEKSWIKKKAQARGN